MEPEKGQKKKNRFLPLKNWEILAKTSIFEVPILAWSFLQSFSSFGANLTHFIKHFTFFPIFDSQKVPKFESFLKKIIIFWKNQAPGPIANERSQNSASKSLLNSSGDLNATDLVTKNRQKLEKWTFSNSFSTFFLSGWLPGNLGPFSNERSQNSASDPLIDSSVRPNLTHFMSVQSSKFYVFLFILFFFHFFMFFPQPPIPYLLCLVRHHQGTNGKHHLPNGKHHLPLVFILNQASP